MLISSLFAKDERGENPMLHFHYKASNLTLIAQPTTADQVISSVVIDRVTLTANPYTSNHLSSNSF